MRKPSKYVTREGLRDEHDHRILAESALHLALTSQPDAVQRVSTTGTDYYLLSLYGRQRAHGGILIVRFVHPNQADGVSAFYFEAYARDAHTRLGLSDESTAFAVACERLNAGWSINA